MIYAIKVTEKVEDLFAQYKGVYLSDGIEKKISQENTQPTTLRVERGDTIFICTEVCGDLEIGKTYICDCIVSAYAKNVKRGGVFTILRHRNYDSTKS